MTTFTSEDRISSAQYFTKGPWPNFPWTNAKDYRQSEISFFWPLTEQIPLNLSFEGCDIKPKVTATNHTNCVWATVATNINPQPQLTITPNNSVGEIHIGNIRVGLEKKPSWYQRVMYRLLGFNWRNK